MSNSVRDKEARDRIRTDIHSNFFVEAGAGSGKTTVLVDRIVSMVENGIDISRICAITFTKAAALEFYDRLRNKLAKSGSDRAGEALRNIDLCFMGTIDSFCNMVISEHPAKARVPSSSEIVSDDELKVLYRRELSRIRCGEYESECPGIRGLSDRFMACFFNGEELFISNVQRLAETRNAILVFPEQVSGSIEGTYGERVSGIKSLLLKIRSMPSALSTGSRSAEEAAKALEDGIRNIDCDWDENLSSTLYTLTRIRKLRVDAGFDVELLGPWFGEVFEPHFTRNKITWYEIRQDGDPLLIDKLNSVRFSVALDFFDKASGLITETLRKEGKLSYADYLLYLRDMLREDAAGEGRLIEHIYNRHSYYLVDEFQDTNPVQAEVLFYLCAKRPDPDWRKCEPKPGSLFIVGDPKQSIYRFRNADVSSFNHVRDLFEKRGGEVLVLSRNYRSTDRLCAWFNRVFSDLLPEDTINQSRFEQIPTGEKEDLEGTLNGAYRYSVKNERSFRNSEDPATVADIIKSIMSDPDALVQDSDKESKSMARRARYSDFMLITPGKGHMAYYMQAFSERGIPFRIEGKLLFDECPALRLISDVMSAVSDRFDRKSRFILESLGSCRMDDEKLEEYREKTSGFSPAALFSLILDEERVFEKAGSENAEYLYYALELLRQAETDGKVSSIQDGADFLQGLIDTGSDQERCIQLERDTDRVHIANLHKVKGLEAPIVILADPNQRTQDPDHRVDYSGEFPKHYIFSLGSTCSSTAHAGEMELERQDLLAERARLLYVAATRAKNVLIAGISYTAKGETNENNPWHILGRYIDRDIFEAVHHITAQPVSREKADAASLYDKGEKASVLSDRSPEEGTYEICRPSTLRFRGVSEPEEAEGVSHAVRRSAVDDPALVGTMVHRIMEALVSSRNTIDGDLLADEMLREFANGDSQYSELLRTVISTIRNGGYEQANGAPRDILSELLDAESVYCELPFCYAEDECHIWNGVIDVAYRKSGKWHIVDYKTNADPSDLDQHYQEQLKAYISAFASMTGETADALIYHIELKAQEQRIVT